MMIKKIKIVFTIFITCIIYYTVEYSDRELTLLYTPKKSCNGYIEEHVDGTAIRYIVKIKVNNKNYTNQFGITWYDYSEFLNDSLAVYYMEENPSVFCIGGENYEYNIIAENLVVFILYASIIGVVVSHFLPKIFNLEDKKLR